MTKRMLIDATHAEETRVVVLDGNRLEDFDVETSTKKQLKGNIYLAKVIRVEPSLQAAFVEYGGNRHGFLAFGEIHPDYYQIPVADRQRLLAAQAEEARREEQQEDDAAARAEAEASGRPLPLSAPDTSDEIADRNWSPNQAGQDEAESIHGAFETDAAAHPAAMAAQAIYVDPPAHHDLDPQPEIPHGAMPFEADSLGGGDSQPREMDEPFSEAPPPEMLGGAETDVSEDPRERRIPPKFLRNYKIQEVIRRRQVLLIQVVKEERGNKGAALTTYISLAGRYCVLMPNSPRGGGISRKITSANDRRRLKEITTELEIPPGMGLIVRTAGANRPKPEIKRDCEYLMRLWDDIREHTLRSMAPALIYEEASLIKRSIRDVYSRDVDEIIVDGEEGWRAARGFMSMLMPTHARKVQLYQDSSQPLFAKNQVEAQLDAMLSPTVQLKSGGYLVINQAEALVAIDVNSGRSTRERNVEETALRTNLEASDEVARQLRLRDLAGLIVIDYIDMESKKHNAMVERRLKEALKDDRARIQVGHISHFGLMEMSRQRLRPSLAETSFVACAHCNGTGLVRSTENAAIHVLRAVEEEGAKRRAAEINVACAPSIALYLLNHKRDRLTAIEQRHAMKVIFTPDAALVPPQLRIDRLRPYLAAEAVTAPVPQGVQAQPAIDPPDAEFADDSDVDPDEIQDAPILAEAGEKESKAPEAAPPGGSAEERQTRRRRRRRRRGNRREGTEAEQQAQAAQDAAEDAAQDSAEDAADDAEEAGGDAEHEAALPPVLDVPVLDVPVLDAPVLDAIEPVDVAAVTAALEAELNAAIAPLPETIPDVITEAAPTVVAAAAAPDAGSEPAESAPARKPRRRAPAKPKRAAAAAADAPLPEHALPGADQPELSRTDIFAVPAMDIVAAADAADAAAAARKRPARPRRAPRAKAPAAEAVVAEAPAEPAPVAEAPKPALTLVSSEAPAAESQVPAEPVSGPVIKPVVIGQDSGNAAPKRGWWRR
jgi:ribonuclease E